MYQFRPHDTSPEAWAVQIEIYRKMSRQQRIELAAQLSESVRQVAAEGVRRRHPEYSDEEVRLSVMRLSIGDELFRAAYPDCHLGS